jgi:hypothetical protein
MRRSFQSAGVATPWFAEISTPQELQRAVIARGRDLTIKPVENRGAEGAVRLTQADDFATAFLAVRAASPSERVMVEQQGDAMPAAGLMQAGLCQSDAAKDISGALGRAASALGMMDGPVAAEVVQQGGQILVGDVSPRLALTGALLDAAIRQAFGE